MNWGTIKRDQADILFSRYIRLKAGKCENCGRLGSGTEGITGLQASHFHGRRKESVRFDPENVDCFCIGCHKKLGTDNRSEYEAYKLKQLGQKRYDSLTIRANTPGVKDRKLEKLKWTLALKELIK